MKAIVYSGYGSADAVRLEDVDRPAVDDDEVLVRVRAASVNPYDWHWLTGLPYVSRLQYGLRKPKNDRLGADLAGVVETVGSEVTRFRPGDEVFGEVNGETPGHPMLELGSFADYVSVSESWLALKPTGMTFEEAAVVPLAAITAWQGFHHIVPLQPGQGVLINGASGGVGTYAVQIAKALGATVTGVCSTRNVDMVRSLGADHVIDYTSDDFTKVEARYDVILDNVGNRSISACRRVLKPKGTYLGSFGQPENRWLGPAAKLARMPLLSRLVSQRIVFLYQHRNKEDLPAIAELIEAGKIRSVIDRTYPLADTADAFRYFEKGRTAGKIVITV